MSIGAQVNLVGVSDTIPSYENNGLWRSAMLYTRPHRELSPTEPPLLHGLFEGAYDPLGRENIAATHPPPHTTLTLVPICIGRPSHTRNASKPCRPKYRLCRPLLEMQQKHRKKMERKEIEPRKEGLLLRTIL